MKGFEHAIGDTEDCVGIEAFEYNGELVSPHPGDGIERTNAGSEAIGNDDEQAVAGAVSCGVVDRLEVIHVEEHHPDGSSTLFRAHERLAKTIAEESSIWKPGEGIFQRFDLAGFPANEAYGTCGEHERRVDRRPFPRVGDRVRVVVHGAWSDDAHGSVFDCDETDRG